METASDGAEGLTKEKKNDLIYWRIELYLYTRRDKCIRLRSFYSFILKRIVCRVVFMEIKEENPLDLFMLFLHETNVFKRFEKKQK
jgi:hypothetical protein